MRAAVVLVLSALLLVPAGVAAMEMDSGGGPQVSILFGSVSPAKVDVVAGDTVNWANDSVREHTVTASDGSFDSGTLPANGHYSRMFDTAGVYGYYCRLHPYIRGEVDVHALLLDRPAQPAAPGRPYPLTGRAALASGTPVAIEFDDGSGSWRTVAQASVGVDGGFAAQVDPTTSGSYRAVAGADESPPVDLLVLNRSLTASARRARGGSRVSVTVSPSAPGATVVLQLYLKDHFGWWPVSQRRLGKDSRASFALRHQRAVSARVVLTLPDGATVIAASKLLRLR